MRVQDGQTVKEEVHVLTIPEIDMNTLGKLKQALNSRSQISYWSLDLEDWENVLRVISSLSELEVQSILHSHGVPVNIMNH